jgi:hypothetical protein
VASSRLQSNETPHRMNCRRNSAIAASVEARGGSPVLIAWFSAGKPNAS